MVLTCKACTGPVVETKGFHATDSGGFPTGSNTGELPVLQTKDCVDAQWNVNTSCEVRTTKLHVTKMLTLMNEGSTGHLFATKVVPAHACRQERTLCSASSKKGDASAPNR